MNRTDHLRIIYFAVVISTVIYAVVVWAATNQRLEAQPLDEELRSPVTLALYGAAIVAYLAAFAVAAQMPRRSARSIARWTMLEAVAVFGVVAALFHGDWRLYMPPWLLALIGFSRAFPRSERGTVT